MPLSSNQKITLGVAVAGAGVLALAKLVKGSGWEPEPPEPGKANVYGRIIEAVDFIWQGTQWATKGDPISGAFVVIEKGIGNVPFGAALSDEEGKYLIENIETDNYTATFSKVNHHAVALVIAVKKGNNLVNVALEHYWPGWG